MTLEMMELKRRLLAVKGTIALAEIEKNARRQLLGTNKAPSLKQIATPVQEVSTAPTAVPQNQPSNVTLDITVTLELLMLPNMTVQLAVTALKGLPQQLIALPARFQTHSILKTQVSVRLALRVVIVKLPA